ncbi:MAG TPA: DUF296 domain-containing protein [Methylomirabilota bacterium]|nr:DUF296 domain-containing protein [Methylomirabilota bacterium]
MGSLRTWVGLIAAFALSALFATQSHGATPAGLQTHHVQLSRGEDLLNTLQQFGRTQQLNSAVVLSASGSLTRAAILLPEREQPTVLTGAWTLISLTGSLNRTNALLQISMSDKDGRTMGGQLMEGTTVGQMQVMLGDLASSPAPQRTNAGPTTIQPPILSPEITPDKRVIVRLLAPNATSVAVAGDWGGGVKPLTMDAAGIWSGTVGPLEPDIYSYTFIVDELRMLDPGNSWVKPARSPRSSIVRVPGDTLLAHDFQDVPHGVLRQHMYDSKSLKRQRSVVVYTPPDYDKNALSRYPTLYLLHGNGDTEQTWSVLGRVGMIMDNLIASAKAKPMLVVMPDAHALAPEGAGADYRQRNREALRTELLQEILPLVESNYRVAQTNTSRALAGLSMGGGQALIIGLAENRFGWVGGFSPSLPDAESALASVLDDSRALNDRLKLLWLACGKDDFLIDQSRKFNQLLTQKKVRHQFTESDGGHTWPVWRKYLGEFAPLLFQTPSEVTASRP